MKKISVFLKEWVPTLTIAIVISASFNTYVAQGMRVPTGSMLPTIQINDRIFVEKIQPVSNYEFGDIVVFWPPIAGNKDRYVKRLIGLPGDTIEIKDGFLYRNGEKVEEPYIEEKIKYTFHQVTVPEDHYFLLGDNRNESFDSHSWKETPFVAEEDIIGKAIFRYYPLDEMGPMK